MNVNIDHVRQNVRSASTEDLLHRATVYRAGMDPAALEVIDGELARRGIDDEAIQLHFARNADVMMTEEGFAERCSFCDAPALVRHWGWHKVWGLLPVFPWRFRYCRDHVPPLGKADG